MTRLGFESSLRRSDVPETSSEVSLIMHNNNLNAQLHVRTTVGQVAPASHQNRSRTSQTSSTSTSLLLSHNHNGHQNDGQIPGLLTSYNVEEERAELNGSTHAHNPSTSTVANLAGFSSLFSSSFFSSFSSSLSSKRKRNEHCHDVSPNPKRLKRRHVTFSNVDVVVTYFLGSPPDSIAKSSDNDAGVKSTINRQTQRHVSFSDVNLVVTYCPESTPCDSIPTSARNGVASYVQSCTSLHSSSIRSVRTSIYRRPFPGSSSNVHRNPDGHSPNLGPSVANQIRQIAGAVRMHASATHGGSEVTHSSENVGSQASLTSVVYEARRTNSCSTLSTSRHHRAPTQHHVANVTSRSRPSHTNRPRNDSTHILTAVMRLTSNSRSHQFSGFSSRLTQSHTSTTSTHISRQSPSLKTSQSNPAPPAVSTPHSQETLHSNVAAAAPEVVLIVDEESAEPSSSSNAQNASTPRLASTATPSSRRPSRRPRNQRGDRETTSSHAADPSTSTEVHEHLLPSLPINDSNIIVTNPTCLRKLRSLHPDFLGLQEPPVASMLASSNTLMQGLGIRHNLPLEVDEVELLRQSFARLTISTKRTSLSSPTIPEKSSSVLHTNSSSRPLAADVGDTNTAFSDSIPAASSIREIRTEFDHVDYSTAASASLQDLGAAIVFDEVPTLGAQSEADHERVSHTTNDDNTTSSNFQGFTSALVLNGHNAVDTPGNDTTGALLLESRPGLTQPFRMPLAGARLQTDPHQSLPQHQATVDNAIVSHGISTGARPFRMPVPGARLQTDPHQSRPQPQARGESGISSHNIPTGSRSNQRPLPAARTQLNPSQPPPQPAVEPSSTAAAFPSNPAVMRPFRMPLAGARSQSDLTQSLAEAAATSAANSQVGPRVVRQFRTPLLAPGSQATTQRPSFSQRTRRLGLNRTLRRPPPRLSSTRSSSPSSDSSEDLVCPRTPPPGQLLARFFALHPSFILDDQAAAATAENKLSENERRLLLKRRRRGTEGDRLRHHAIALGVPADLHCQMAFTRVMNEHRQQRRSYRLSQQSPVSYTSVKRRRT